MNERYGPVFLRMAIIVGVLICLGIGLVIYLQGNGSSLLKTEQKKAADLGWIHAASKVLPPPTDEERRVLDVEKEAASKLADADAIRCEKALRSLTDPALIQATEGSAKVLKARRQELAGIREAMLGSESMSRSRINLIKAMTMRASAFARAGKMEDAEDALTSAYALCNIFSGSNSRANLSLDAMMRVAWCRIAVAHPDFEPLPPLTGVLGHERAIIRRRLSETYRPNISAGSEGVQEKRAEFDQLHFANKIIVENAEKSGDTLTCWKYLKEGLDTYHFERIQNFIPSISSMIKAQFVRDQICRLFSEALKSPGVEPASLAQSKDPYNNLKPLKFRTFADGFALYSIGDDAVDGKANEYDFGVKVVKGKVLANLEGGSYQPWQ